MAAFDLSIMVVKAAETLNFRSAYNIFVGVQSARSVSGRSNVDDISDLCVLQGTGWNGA